MRRKLEEMRRRLEAAQAAELSELESALKSKQLAAEELQAQLKGKVSRTRYLRLSRAALATDWDIRQREASIRATKQQMERRPSAKDLGRAAAQCRGSVLEAALSFEVNGTSKRESWVGDD